MKTIKRIFVSFVLFCAVALPVLFNDGAQVSHAVEKRVVISSVSAVLKAGEPPQEVVLSGIPYQKDSPYFTDIKIEGKDFSFSPKENGGYSPSLNAFDFLGEGYCQLYYAASTGGSGGFGIYYVYDVSSGVKTIFDFAEYKNVFSGKYVDGLAQISADGKPFAYFPANGRVGAPEISDINHVEPSYGFLLNRYRLTIWQKVTGDYQADVLGYIVTLLDLKDNTAFPYAVA